MMKGQRAFSLTELLVSLATISLLSAILLPVFSKARERAQRTACQNNLRQLFSAFQQYLNDWDEVFPNSWQSSPSPYGELNHSYWDVQISPYVKDDAVFFCPTNDFPSYSVHQPFGPQGLKTRRVTYALNNQILGCEPSPDPYPYNLRDPYEPAHFSDVESPSETILLAEKMQDYPGHEPSLPHQRGNQSEEIDVWYHLVQPGIRPGEWDPTWGVARALHNNASNYLFADGHVRYLPIIATFSGVPPSPTRGEAPPPAPPPTPLGPAPPPTVPKGPREEIHPHLWLLRKTR